jgi:hypothetical protein
MAHLVYVARPCDGLVLAEAREGTSSVPEIVKSQVLKLLRSLHGVATQRSIEVGGYMVHLACQDGVCFLALFNMVYPRNLAFAFLEEVAQSFQEELKRTFGTGSVDYRSRIDTICQPYYFMSFERQMSRLRAEYRDHKSGRALGRLDASSGLTRSASSTLSASKSTSLSDFLGECQECQDVSPESKSLSSSKTEAWTSGLRLLLMCAVVFLALSLACVGREEQGGGLMLSGSLAAVALLACGCGCLAGNRQTCSPKWLAEPLAMQDFAHAEDML